MNCFPGNTLNLIFTWKPFPLLFGEAGKEELLFIYFKLLMFYLFLRETETELKRRRSRERERETQTPKQAPASEPSARACHGA